MLPEPYQRLHDRLSRRIPADRLITDPLRTLAHGTDASFYRLIPKMVVKARSEAEAAAVIRAADEGGLPVTFRAAGTSLSGQAISDSILLMATSGWGRCEVLDGGGRIRLGPGVIGGHANTALLPFGRKIGPDPASINAAMVGGIAANNASGMCCGTAENSYKTISSLRMILADGTLLDTGDPGSRSAFQRSHGDLLARISLLARNVREDLPLAERIRAKFKIKNTTGYSLNALVDFSDPFDILAHLMIGSEGTLGFLSEIVYHTVVDHPYKATALLVFPDIGTACRGATLLKPTPVSAVELMDRPALTSVEGKPGMPEHLAELPGGSAALLVETRAPDPQLLENQIRTVLAALDPLPMVLPPAFTDRVDEYTRLWNIRKGLFPAVGAVREIGTTVIIEDVAFPIARLDEATVDLRDLLNRHGYGDAIIFGHALEGNLHFVFTQDFAIPAEVARYRDFMDGLCDLVVNRYDGSLKAEHGTGRNMAPFVAAEWGEAAYGLMEEIKAVLDPRNLLNPGVILNPDPQAHLKHLKPLPRAHDLVDKCIECGFCEVRCPSRDLTLTPRHRITVSREIARLERSGGDPSRLRSLRADYAYQGDETCAADGLCGESCPVAINTGELTKVHRALAAEGTAAPRLAGLAAEGFAGVARMVRWGLGAADAAHRLLGPTAMGRISTGLRELSGGRLPLWTPAMPKPAPAPRRIQGNGAPLSVVYFPSCVSRTMGPARGDPDAEPLHAVARRLLDRAGYGVVLPENLSDLCCGMPFESKGFPAAGDRKLRQLERALLAASENGRLPVLCDTSPCLHRMRQGLDSRLSLFEPVGFVIRFIAPRLAFTPVDGPVALHVSCSSVKMGLSLDFTALAEKCAREVVVPDHVGCCGFAGDRGFTVPELNASALAPLRDQVKGCEAGYSNSRTCEIGLTLHGGIHYKSILYLVDRCTRPKKGA